jgi:hypothetical protein
MSSYYIGVISEVVDPLTYEVKVDINGIVEGKTAFPLRGEVDEPVVGDSVLLRNIDPLYGSVYLYSKLKEDNFIGFRSNGKIISITPDSIEISSGGMDKVTKITIMESGEIDISVGNGSPMNITVEGSANIESYDTMTITSPEIIVKGPGTMKVTGTVIPSAEGGPFCAFKSAPPPGTPMVTGDTIILN